MKLVIRSFVNTTQAAQYSMKGMYLQNFYFLKMEIYRHDKPPQLQVSQVVMNHNLK